MLVADQQMTRATTSEPPPSESNDLTEIKEAMEPKLLGLRDLFVEAENLRMRTLQDLFTLLSPVQAAQYTVAALEMTIAMRKLGDEVREAHSGDSKARPVGRPEKNLRDIASHGDVEELQEALDTGLDPSEADYDGRTALVCLIMKYNPPSSIQVTCSKIQRYAWRVVCLMPNPK